MTIRLFALMGIVTALLVGLNVTRNAPVANACGSGGPYDFDTFEYENYNVAYSTAIDLVTAGKAIPGQFTVGTEIVDVRYQGVKSGPRLARLNENTAMRIPPSIYKSIVWIEAKWQQADGDTLWGGVGWNHRAPDCGYGLGQITSGMSNDTGSVTAKQAAIGTHYLVNIAEGVRILADKWNSAPRFRPIAGTGNPAIVEDWYYAIWSYNGFAFSNHPLNPLRDPLRGGDKTPIYHCGDPAAPSYLPMANGSPMFGAQGNYTYPERVYGCMQYPPIVDPVGPAPAVRLYPKQDVNMPDMEIEEIAEAFDPAHFTDCQAASFTGGCPLMDFLTAFPDKKITPHVDNTPAVDPAKAAQLLGAPVLAYSGPTSGNITVQANGTANSIQVSVSNIGTGIGTFRVRSSKPWIVARHPGDPASRTMDGGVALGADMPVVVQRSPLITTPGYTSVLNISVIPALMPAGSSTAVLYIDPLLAGGDTFAVTITVFRPEIINVPTATPTLTVPVPGSPSVPTSTPTATPTATPTPDPYPFKAVAPNINKDD